ncbi:hypothetical protein ACLOJK_027158 [Asimina triloba]
MLHRESVAELRFTRVIPAPIEQSGQPPHQTGKRAEPSTIRPVQEERHLASKWCMFSVWTYWSSMYRMSVAGGIDRRSDARLGSVSDTGSGPGQRAATRELGFVVV